MAGNSVLTNAYASIAFIDHGGHMERLLIYLRSRFVDTGGGSYIAGNVQIKIR